MLFFFYIDVEQRKRGVDFVKQRIRIAKQELEQSLEIAKQELNQARVARQNACIAFNTITSALDDSVAQRVGHLLDVVHNIYEQ